MDTPPRMKTVAEQIFGDNKAPLADVLATDFADLSAEVGRALETIGKATKLKDEADFAATGALVNRVKAFVTRLDTTRKRETDPLFQAQKAVKAHFDVLIDKLEKALQPHLDAANDYTRAKAAEEKARRLADAEKLRQQQQAELQKADDAKTTVTAARAEGRAEALGAQADRLEGAPSSAADAVRTKIAGGGTASARTIWNFRVADYAALDLNQLRDFIPQDDIDKAIRSKVRVQKANTKLTGVEVFEDTTASFR